MVVLCCLACGREEKQPSAVQASALGDDQPVDGGTLLRRLEGDVSTLNPTTASAAYDRLVSQYIFTPVIHLDRNLQPVPGLADAWDISEDGLTYRFLLNKKATFSDGRPVRASDVVFTLRKIVDPSTEAIQHSGAFDQMDPIRTRAVDDHTVEVVFRQPRGNQLTKFNDVLVLPEHVYAKGNFRRDFNDQATGSGPYVLVRREPGRQIILERRKDYWGDRPHIERVVFKVIEDYHLAFNALRRGEIDATLLASDVWEKERTNPDVTRIVDFQRFYTLNYNYIAWNGRHPAFADKRVRRAMSMCVPTDAIINDLYHGTARAMSGPFTPDEWAYNPNVPVIRHDLEGARKLLAEAGWTDADGDGVVEKGRQKLAFEFLVMRGNTGTAFAQMLQAELKKVGVDIEITVMDGAAAIERLMSGDYEAGYLSWNLDPDPDLYALFHSTQTPGRGQNLVYYANPEADRLIEQARVELDQDKRKDLHWRLHEVLAADQPYTWVVQVSEKWGTTRRVRGEVVSRGFGYFLWYPGELGWWIAPAR